ncbi:NAD(P)H-dependent oxidoreductase [Candidatus Binatia bacterium]|nr:NAD(P)H-dependent oxidoreductase [Candidatus Binatia bacterium]
MATLAALAGSARRDSFNKKALNVMARGARDAGAQVTVIDLADFPLPIYDGDCEAELGIPEPVARLRQIFADHDGILIAAPEYNGLITPLLKNTFDWLSRPYGERQAQSGLACLRGKVAGVVSASPGAFGGIRALPITRQYLANLGLALVAEQAVVSAAHTAFDGDDLRDEKLRAAVMTVGAAVARLAEAVRTLHR